MSKNAITIFHNPACGTSRQVLALIREAGHEPDIVEYLKTGWTLPQLKGLLAAMSARPVDILRKKNSPAAELVAELRLLEEGTTDAAILDAMVRHPILVERPIVVTPKGTLLARPPEKVITIL
jgi:arsenate reductase (glutaredoxin)